MTAPRSERSASLLVGSTPPDAGESPQCRPDFEEIARHAPGALLARPLGGVGADERLVGAPEATDRCPQLTSVTGVLVDLPRLEDFFARREAGLAELPLCSEPSACAWKSQRRRDGVPAQSLGGSPRRAANPPGRRRRSVRARLDAPMGRSRGLLEDHAKVVEELPLEADLVRADARGKRVAEALAPRPVGQQR
jgi:hypothetical protein